MVRMSVQENPSFEVKRPDRAALHLPRRLFHMLSGVLIVTLSYLIEDRQLALVLLASFVVAEFLLELLKVNFEFFQTWAAKLFGGLMRAGEESRISGIPYYGAGCLIAYSLFPQPVAALAVLFLAIGDPIASIAGGLAKKRGRLSRLRGKAIDADVSAKSLEGSLACWAACSMVTAVSFPVFFENTDFGALEILGVAAVGGCCATIAELLPLRTDDNLSIPLISGCLFWLFASLIGVLPGLML